MSIHKPTLSLLFFSNSLTFLVNSLAFSLQVITKYGVITDYNLQIDVKIKKKLKELKIHPKESYSSVIERLLKLKIGEEPLSKETIKRIEKESILLRK